MDRTNWNRLVGVAVLCALVAGCQSPHVVQVRANRHESVFHDLQQNLVTAQGPSARTEQLLRRLDLSGKFRRDPLEVLALLDRECRAEPSPDIVFALAELSFLTGKRLQPLNKRVATSLYGATVAYAYFYLFDEEVGTLPDAYDPRFRLACDLYNNALARCIRLTQSREIRLDDAIELDLAEGRMEIEVTRHGFLWEREEFGHFLFASDYEVQGLTNQYHAYGLGVPLIAVSDRPRDGAGEGKFYPPRHSFPVTAFLRMNCDARAPRDGIRQATLELHDPLRVQSIAVAGRDVPLESDLTKPLGYFLSKARFDKFELTGLLRADKVQDKTGLYMLQPYERGKIPVVMVHGLWSSPLAWMQMFNDLRGDPEIRDRFQFWFFQYPTGNPLLYSASTLRRSLVDALATIDPAGTDDSLRHAVLVGHSMGGLLSKLMVQESKDELWQLVSNRPIDRIDAPAEDLEKVKQAFFFEPQTYVKRVVFIATPHRGSTLSDGLIGRISSRLIALPRNLVRLRAELLARNPGAFQPGGTAGLPTSVDNLSPESPVIQVVGKLPLDRQVTYHSIIANIKDGDPRDGTDGVVPYSSSHLDGAASEDIVPSGHACQSHPLTVLAVRRILLEHLRELEEAGPIRRAAHAETGRAAEPAGAAPR